MPSMKAPGENKKAQEGLSCTHKMPFLAMNSSEREITHKYIFLASIHHISR